MYLDKCEFLLHQGILLIDGAQCYWEEYEILVVFILFVGSNIYDDNILHLQTVKKLNTFL